MFEEKSTVDKLATLRTTKEESGDKKHAMVESVTSERSNVNDDCAEHRRPHHRAARARSSRRPKRSDSSETASSKGKTKKGSKAEEATPVKDSDDPISGLGL